MRISVEKKLRDLAMLNAQLVTDLTWPNIVGVPTFMWFDQQLVQGDIGQRSDGKTVVRAHCISSIRPAMSMGGIGSLVLPLIQIDIAGYVSEQTRVVGFHIIDFMMSMSLLNPGNYTSPKTGPVSNPNSLQNERPGLMPQLNPPPFVWTQDWRVYGDDNVPS